MHFVQNQIQRNLELACLMHRLRIMRAKTLTIFACLAFFISAYQYVRGQDFERDPINYGKSQPNNPVSRLADDLASGKRSLTYELHFGYLRSLLKELGVPESSQMLVFSKTSLQRHRIAPRTPRSLYFSDDIYIGFCQYGDVLEISVADPKLGAVFYTIDQDEEPRPKVLRHGDNCLICHGSSQTKSIPGHLVRSVYADAAGLPILSSGTHRIDHTSPLKHRWGGWYVTGTHGPQTHLGNLVVRGKQEPEQIDNAAGMNVTDITNRIDLKNFLTPHSDLVALMVLEHQADAHNFVTQAAFQTRIALHYEQALRRELARPADEPFESTKSRIRSACEPLVEYLLFCDEAELTHRLQGTSTFAAEFARRGPFDKQGRTLREFDLTRRIFKYPCSYLIYSPSFDALPRESKDYVFRRFDDILSGRDQSKKFAHLSAADRQAIREILVDTLPGVPENWRQ